MSQAPPPPGPVTREKVASWSPGQPVVDYLPLRGKVTTYAPVGLQYARTLQAAYPDVDVAQQIRAYAAWAQSNPSKRKTPSGIARSVDFWMKKEEEVVARARLRKEASDRGGTGGRRTYLGQQIEREAAERNGWHVEPNVILFTDDGELLPAAALTHAPAGDPCAIPVRRTRTA